MFKLPKPKPKYRVVHDGSTGHYYPQVKGWFFWSAMPEPGYDLLAKKCGSMELAEKFIENEIAGKHKSAVVKVWSL